MSAAGWGVEQDIRALVRGGARINMSVPDGSTALMIAVDKGRVENVSLLLRRHTDATCRMRRASLPSQGRRRPSPATGRRRSSTSIR